MDTQSTITVERRALVDLSTRLGALQDACDKQAGYVKRLAASVAELLGTAPMEPAKAAAAVMAAPDKAASVAATPSTPLVRTATPPLVPSTTPATPSTTPVSTVAVPWPAAGYDGPSKTNAKGEVVKRNAHKLECPCKACATMYVAWRKGQDRQASEASPAPVTKPTPPMPVPAAPTMPEVMDVRAQMLDILMAQLDGTQRAALQAVMSATPTTAPAPPNGQNGAAQHAAPPTAPENTLGHDAAWGALADFHRADKIAFLTSLLTAREAGTADPAAPATIEAADVAKILRRVRAYHPAGV